MNNKNKIYLVSGGWDYEGSRVLKAFFTRENAELFASSINNNPKDHFYDYITVSEMEVEE